MKTPNSDFIKIGNHIDFAKKYFSPAFWWLFENTPSDINEYEAIERLMTVSKSRISEIKSNLDHLKIELADKEFDQFLYLLICFQDCYIKQGGENSRDMEGFYHEVAKTALQKNHKVQGVVNEVNLKRIREEAEEKNKGNDFINAMVRDSEEFINLQDNFKERDEQWKKLQEVKKLQKEGEIFNINISIKKGGKPFLVIDHVPLFSLDKIPEITYVEQYLSKYRFAKAENFKDWLAKAKGEIAAGLYKLAQKEFGLSQPTAKILIAYVWAELGIYYSWRNKKSWRSPAINAVNASLGIYPRKKNSIK